MKKKIIFPCFVFLSETSNVLPIQSILEVPEEEVFLGEHALQILDTGPEFATFLTELVKKYLFFLIPYQHGEGLWNPYKSET
jgi:hypothetical protein